jgi:hypothetical protein
VGLHQYIFEPTCADPACHDGSFEPDFRTVESTYSTLVYHPVVKNTQDGAFRYRVVPGHVDASWLHERLTTDNQTLGRMPLYKAPLTDGELSALKAWINKGAPDLYGTAATLPNTQPRLRGVAAFIDTAGIAYRVDTLRDNSLTYSPFFVLHNRRLTLWFDLADDSTSVDRLTGNRLLLALQRSDFSNAKTFPATYDAAGRTIEDFYGPGQAATFHWRLQLHTGQFPRAVLVFLRYEAGDPDHPAPVTTPHDSTEAAIQYHYAFFNGD